MLFSVFFVFVALAVYLFTWERPRDEIAHMAAPVAESLLATSASCSGTCAATLRIRAFRLHLGMYLGGYISQDMLNPVLSYFIAFALAGTVVTMSVITTAMAVRAAGLGGARRSGWRCAYTRRRRIASRSRCSRAGVVGLLSLYAAGVTRSHLVSSSSWSSPGLGRGALNYIPWSVYNYMPDVDEIVTGRRREGAFAGVMTFVRKFMQSIAIFIVTQILDASGLIPKSSAAAAESC